VNRPIGGAKQIYRQVQTLHDAGITAFVLHKRQGFRCTWFEHRAPVAYLGQSQASYLAEKAYTRIRNRTHFDIAVQRGREVLIPDGPGDGDYRRHILGDGDLVVLPEFHGYALNGAVEDLPLAIFNQNPHGTFRGYPTVAGACPTVYRSRNLTGVVVVSEHSKQYLEFAFPGLPIGHVVNGVDSALFHPNDTRKPRTLAFMPRKLPSHVEQAINLLRYRGALRGWSLAPIDGMNETGVAAMLRQSTVFMSTCTEEGFGLPPLEAAMSGCVVVGYSGRAADEYMDSRYCEPVAQHDVLELASVVEQTMRYCEQHPTAALERAQQFSAQLSERYSLERERQSIIAAWSTMLERASHGSPNPLFP